MGDAPSKHDRMAEDPNHKTFRPNVRDYFDHEVKTNHAANQVLHDLLREADTVDNTNFMSSHAPGEKPHPPDYEVYCTFNNGGLGHPKIRDPLRQLIKIDRVKLCDVVECSDDELTVSVRPIERTVEPVEVDYADIPDDVVSRDTIEFVLRHFADDFDANTAASKVIGDIADELGADVDTGFDDWEGPVEPAAADTDQTAIGCGCGDYVVQVPSDPILPEAIDVVCPECGNHFGFGSAADEPCPCNHDHDQGGSE